MCVRLLPLALILLAGCGPHRAGSGVAATEGRPLAACRGVRVDGQVTLTVTRGDVPALAVTWDENLLDLVTTDVRDGLLEVSVRGSYSATTPLAVTVTLPALRSVRAGGQATVVADVGTVPDFTAIAGGQSRITLRGSADTQDLDASGQSRLDAGGLTGKTATVAASGQSRVTVGVSKRVQVIAGGQSTVEHAAADESVSTSGQATVRRR